MNYMHLVDQSLLRLRSQVEQEFNDVSRGVRCDVRLDDHFCINVEQTLGVVEAISMRTLSQNDQTLDGLIGRFSRIANDMAGDGDHIKSREQLIEKLGNHPVSVLLGEYLSYFTASVYPRILKSEARRMERNIS